MMADDEEGALKGPKFSPPVYQQRYDAVINLVNENNYKKVFDIGCSEGKLLSNIKIHCPTVEVIYGLDIDKNLLMENRFRTKPLMAEYLVKRNVPLKIALFNGSVAKPDVSFSGFEFISCIEVIEHLPKESLDAFPAAIFGVLQPKTLALTTPNADFNILFPGMVGFRHPDHKFEWTREEFQNWCKLSAETYGYTVEFSFIGYGPDETEHLGGCTQMAIFTKNPQHYLAGSLLKDVVHGKFELITETVYPFEPLQSMEERLLKEIHYMVYRYAINDTEAGSFDDSALHKEVPLNYLLQSPSVKSICKDTAFVRNTICGCYSVDEDKEYILVPVGEEDKDTDDEDYDDDDDDEKSFIGETGIAVGNDDGDFGFKVCFEETWD